MTRKEASFQAGFSVLYHDLASLQEQQLVLHPQEKSYADQLKFDRRKHSYLLGRVSAKHALTNILNQPITSVFIDYGVFQFPVVKNVPDINAQVSISHCDDLGLALAFPEEHPMGLDIEKVEDKIVETLDSQITDKEKALLAASNLSKEKGYTLFWTVKEALSKILRTGLMMDFKVLQIESLKFDGQSFTCDYTHCGQYKSLSIIVGDYVCTLVLPKNTTVDLTDYWSTVINTITT